MLQTLHAAWRRLPPRLRREAYDFATAFLAPRLVCTPETPTGIAEPIVVAGALSAPTGLGEAARLTLHGLIAAGLDARAIDLSAGLMQRSVVPVPDTPPMAPGPGTLLLFAQPPNVAHGLMLIGRELLRDKRRVGCWVWDLEVMPRPWINAAALLHEIAAPSAFCQRTFARHLDRPVRRLSYPLAVAAPHEPARVARSVTTFGAAFDLGSTAARKNPHAIVAAFRQAFGSGDAVRLLLKLRDESADPKAAAELRRQAAAGQPAVTIVSGDFDKETLARWWDEIDVLVSLHRSEGFGLVPAEAMVRMIPVISTDWSATAEMITSETGWPVPATLVPAHDATGRYEVPGAVWADPDVAAAAQAMRDAHARPDEVARRGRAARTFLLETYSVARLKHQVLVPSWQTPE